MLGAIAGDIIGSAYEWHSAKRTDFDLFTPSSKFTDDTVLTVAVADCILTGKDYVSEPVPHCPKSFLSREREWSHATALSCQITRQVRVAQ